MGKIDTGIGHITEFKLVKYKVDEEEVRKTLSEEGDEAAEKLAYSVEEWEGNIGLNEGLQLMWDLTIGAGGTAYNNINAHCGVGNSNTVAAATDTGLIGTNAYGGMEVGFPSRSNQTVTFKSVFGSAVANFRWNEFTVANSGSNAGTNLFRKVHDRGEKYSGETWTLEVKITLE